MVSLPRLVASSTRAFTSSGTEGDVLGAVALARTCAACRGELDHVGSHAHHLADHVAHCLRAVGDSDGAHGVGGVGRAVAGGRDSVADAARRRNDGHGADQARPGDQTFGYGLLESGVQAASVADGGVSGGQRVLYGPGCLQVRKGGRLLDFPPGEKTVVLVGQVVVGVDQAGEQCQTGEINDLRIGWDVHGSPGSSTPDDIAVQHHHGVFDDRAARAVNQSRSNQRFHGNCLRRRRPLVSVRAALGQRDFWPEFG